MAVLLHSLVYLLICACFFMISRAGPVDQSCSHKVADIVFVLDTSKSIWEDQFTQQLQFVENIVNQFPVSERGVHVGVILFGSQVFPQFYLHDYYSKKDLLLAIAQIQYLGGATITGSAIKHAREFMFSTENGAREGVDKIMFVITDGYSADKENTSTEAAISKKQGIKMMAVGVGFGVDGTELIDIASSRTEHAHFVFRVDDFPALETIEQVVTQTACDIMTEEVTAGNGDKTEETIKGCGQAPTDVIFVIDSSSSVTSNNYIKVLDFVADTVAMFDVGPKATRVGVVTYSDDVNPAILLDNGLGKTTLLELILQLPHRGGGTKTTLALKYLNKHGFHSAHARNGARRVAILLTDGQSESPIHAQREAARLRRRNVDIFVVGMPGHADKMELQSLASQPSNKYVLEVHDYTDLPSLKDKLVSKACLAGSESGGVQNDQNDKELPMCRPVDDVDVMYLYDANSIGPKRAAEIRETVVAAIRTTQSLKVRSGISSKSCRSFSEPGLMMTLTDDLIADRVNTLQADVLPEMLHGLRLDGFSAENGGRLYARKIAFLILDGDLTDYHELRKEAKRLRFLEAVELYVVGVGFTNVQELNDIVSQPSVDHVINFDSIKQMEKLKTKVFDAVCSN